jgi:hypothetical protein
MADDLKTIQPVDNYPRRIAFIRWFLLALEGGIAIYFAMNLRTDFGILFLAYAVVCLFLIFPLIRCVRCSYYGRRCNFGWGRFWISRFFPKDEINHFGAYYGWSIAFWPLRVVPILLGIRNLTTWIFGKFDFWSQGLFLIYLAVIILHRRFYRTRACPGCHQKAICPVYNGRVIEAEAVQ